MSVADVYCRRKLIAGLIIGGITIGVLLVWNISIYTQIGALETAKNYLQDEVSSLEEDKRYLQRYFDQFQDENDRLRWQVQFYESILEFNESGQIVSSETIVEDANTFRCVMSGSMSYAGYLDVSLSSNASSSYVRVEFSFKGRFFQFQKTFGMSGTDIFFVLPTSMAKVFVGNTEMTGTVNQTIWITYYV